MSYIGNSTPSVTSLGGDLDVNGHQIKSTSNGNIEIVPDGSGTVTIDQLVMPTGTGSNGQALVTDGSGNLSFSSVGVPNPIDIADQSSSSGPSTNAIRLGGSQDFTIFHNSSDNTNYIRNGFSSGNPVTFKIIDSYGQDHIKCIPQGGVEFRYNGGLCFSASSTYSLTIRGAYTFPNADGSSGQVLTTQGNGTVTWQTPSSGGGGGGGGGSSYPTIVIDTTNASTAPQTNYSGYTGNGTIMIGSGGHSYGDYNIGIGFEAECQPYYGIPSMAKCVAIGYYAHADAYQSTAIGRQVVTQYGSNTATACGASSDTKALRGYGGAFSTPMGASMNGSSALAVGRGMGATNEYSVAIGSSDTVTVSHKSAMYITTRKQGLFTAQSSTADSQISIGGTTHAIRFCESYTFPSSDATSSGQQLQSNGAGTLSWASASSDIRLKKSISDNDMGLDFINELNTKIYNFKSYKEIDKSDPQLSHYKPLQYGEDGHDGATQTEDDIPKNLANRQGWQRGLIAQEVKATIDKYGHENFKGWGKDKFGVQEVYMEQFIVPLIKAVQELSEEIKILKNNCKC